MRYFGSKVSTLDDLQRLVLPRIASGTFCDPFGGIGSVGSTFKRRGFEVHSGDLLLFANCFQTARIVLGQRPAAPPALKASLGLKTCDDMLAALNGAPAVKSWIHREFSVLRKYFTPPNAMAIDGARRELARWNRLGLVGGNVDLYLRACLIEAVDRVANTAGTYYAYLKSWTAKALKPFEVRSIKTTPGLRTCSASVRDAHSLVASRHFNVLYLDPPYNRRDYSGYYHLPETLATGRRPRPSGRSGVDRAARKTSAFARPADAEAAMAALLETARADLLVIHYSDDGLVSPERMRTLLGAVGKVDEAAIEALGYGTSAKRVSRHRVFLVEP